MKITKAILIKPADKWMVRVWESVEPTTATIFGRINFNNWLNKYKEYEVHPDYVDKMKRSVYDAWKENGASFFKGVDIKHELIDIVDNCKQPDSCSKSLSRKCICGNKYAILKDVDDKLIHGKSLEYWKKNASEDYITTPISVLRYITILEEIIEKYTLKRK